MPPTVVLLALKSCRQHLNILYFCNYECFFSAESPWQAGMQPAREGGRQAGSRKIAAARALSCRERVTRRFETFRYRLDEQLLYGVCTHSYVLKRIYTYLCWYITVNTIVAGMSSHICVLVCVHVLCVCLCACVQHHCSLACWRLSNTKPNQLAINKVVFAFVFYTS